MAAWSANPGAARLNAFRAATTCLVVLATADVIRAWLALRHAHDLSSMEPSLSPWWMVGLVGLCAVQILFLWWKRIAPGWWELILIELVLCLAVAVCRRQVVGSFLTTCVGGQSCATTSSPAL